MRTKMKIAIAAAAILVLGGGLFQTVEATCTSGSALVQTFDPSGARSQVFTEDYFSGSAIAGLGYYNGMSYYFLIEPFVQRYPADPRGTTPAPVTPAFQGSWWILGTGDPTSQVARGGAGSTPQDSDSGLFNVIVSPGGTNPSPAGGTITYGGFIVNDWNQSPLIDNCPGEDNEGDPADLQFGSCLCVLLTDQWQGEGYMAVVSNLITPVGSGNTNLVRSTRGPALTAPPPAGAPATSFDPIRLKKMPKPRITASTKISNSQVDVTAALDFAPVGIYNEGGCDCAPTRFQLHARNFANAGVGTADLEPADGPGGLWPERDIAAGAWAPVGAPGLVAGTATASLTCAGDESVFLGTQLCFANGANPEFCTPVVSISSTEVECGTNLATPEPPGRGRGKAKGRPDHSRR